MFGIEVCSVVTIKGGMAVDLVAIRAREYCLPTCPMEIVFGKTVGDQLRPATDKECRECVHGELTKLDVEHFWTKLGQR